MAVEQGPVDIHGDELDGQLLSRFELYAVHGAPVGH
jgi:hypothetical protein